MNQAEMRFTSDGDLASPGQAFVHVADDGKMSQAAEECPVAGIGPVEDRPHGLLRRAQQRQCQDAELAGRGYRRSGYVVVDQLGSALHPETLSSRWEALLRTTGLRRIRLHDPRHTCGTLLHLHGLPLAVIAGWLGHADPAFTMRTYVRSQDDALRGVADALHRRSDIDVTSKGRDE